MTIAVGDTVEWEYTQGGTQHTATSGEGSGGTDGDGVPAGALPFDSGLLRPGDTFRVVLREAGAYTYFCEVHPNLMFTALISTHRVSEILALKGFFVVLWVVSAELFRNAARRPRPSKP